MKKYFTNEGGLFASTIGKIRIDDELTGRLQIRIEHLSTVINPAHLKILLEKIDGVKVNLPRVFIATPKTTIQNDVKIIIQCLKLLYRSSPTPIDSGTLISQEVHDKSIEFLEEVFDFDADDISLPNHLMKRFVLCQLPHTKQNIRASITTSHAGESHQQPNPKPYL